MATTQIGILEGHFDPNIPQILPHDRMYNIQIGTKLFKISGASLSSDGPSYFTNYFIKKDSENKYNHNNKNNANYNNNTNDNSIQSTENSRHSSNHGSPASTTSLSSMTASATPRGFHTSNFRQSKDILFIDRSPDIFELIYKHLQGYFINIRDEVEYTMLISDAVYYNLPRLKTLLKKTEYFYTRIGEKSFKFPKDFLRRNGDTQNYFQITSESLYIDVENLILAKKLLRPPPHSYSYVPRSPAYFDMLLQMLSGAILHLNDELRESLIKECKFYRFLNLEQRLIKYKITFNPMTHGEEICLNLDKIVKRGLIIPDISTLNDISKPIIIDINRMLSFSIFPILNNNNNNNNNNTNSNSNTTNTTTTTTNNNNNHNDGSSHDNDLNLDKSNSNTINDSQLKNRNDLNKVMMMGNAGLTPNTENILNLLKGTDDEDDVSNDDFMNLQPLKRQKLDKTNQDPMIMTRDDTIWRFMEYKRPFVDEYSRELSFQMETKECTLIFNKLERMVCLDIVGETAEKFESTFGPLLLRSQGINILDYKISTAPQRSNSNASQNNSMMTREILTNINTHLIIPICLNISNTMINNQLYTGNFTEFFDGASENVLDLVDMTRTARYTLGSHLYLSKSIWKLAIDSTSKSIVLMAVKLDAFNNIRSFGQQLEFL